MGAGLSPGARRAAENRMVDQCTIRRKTGLVTDPGDGKVSTTFETIYQGKCKVQTFTNRELMKNGGEHEFIVQRYEVQVPVSAVGVRVNDEAVIDTSLNDPDLVGRVYRIVGLLNKSMATARRLSVEEPNA